MAIKDEEAARKEIKAVNGACRRLHDDLYLIQKNLTDLERYFRGTSADFENYSNAHRARTASANIKKVSGDLTKLRAALKVLTELQFPMFDLDLEKKDDQDEDEEITNKIDNEDSLFSRIEFDPDEIE